ncbi:MAG: ankyrin repeat domain-containing protein [Planctomycetota bacterium]|jgi:ankyrin repeat protein
MTSSHESLFDAIDDLDVPAVEELCRAHPAWLRQCDEGGLTPLLRAAMHLERDPKLIVALLEAGADARACTEDGESALHLLVDVEGDAGFGDEPLELLRPLVEAGAPLEGPQSDGLTPLALAVVHGTPDEVAAFVALGARVDVRIPEDFAHEALAGRTLLGAALGSLEKVEALVRGGADPAQADAAGESAPRLATRLAEAAREAGDDVLADAIERCNAALTDAAGNA